MPKKPDIKVLTTEEEALRAEIVRRLDIADKNLPFVFYI